MVKRSLFLLVGNHRVPLIRFRKGGIKINGFSGKVSGFQNTNEIKDDLEFLDLTNQTPKVTSRATPQPKTNSTVLDPATSQPGYNTFSGAFAEKKHMEDQDERQREFNNGQQKLTCEILNTLKAIHETLKSIEMSLKPQSIND
ncbi:uncharacterized protein [Eurosta solidaginis]|uniref:uncharacterized protein n=1 Tax=Eurosta solidaginis TaxID=178769 RepID=UPI0035310525